MDAPPELPQAKSKKKKNKQQQQQPPEVPKPSSDPTNAQEHAAADAVPSKDRRKKQKATNPPSLAPDKEATSSCSRQQLRISADADEVALLRAAILFRDERGSLPRRSNILDFFDFVQPSLLSKSLNPDQVRSKLKRLRRKYFDKPSSPAASAGAHDPLVLKLAAQLWPSQLETSAEQRDGEGTAAPAEDGGAGYYYPFIVEVLADYWRENGYLGASLDEAFKRVDPRKAKKLDVKWKKQLEKESRFSVKQQYELGRVFQMLA
ncbi:putative transcription factor [Cocos nucifera]|nr:putative transcription factor [Cocos nucifera]